MARSAHDSELPALYAITPPGLEDVVAEEITTDFKGEVKRTMRGAVVFRLKEIDRSILQLRTAEDVLLYGWGTDQLTYRAVDLDSFQRWTAKDVSWQRLLNVHHAVRPKPKGKPTYRLVTQMTGEHAYRRMDALKALAKGMAGKLPESWRPAEENASVEIWLTIHGASAICGLRLSDRTMRHRTWKHEHFPASLRPPVAAAMARLGLIKPNQTILDPMCGAGTLLAEAYFLARRLSRGDMASWNLTFKGGDIDPGHVRAAQANLRALGDFSIEQWDARRLPIDDESVERILCNPPFGKQLASPEEIGPLYRQSIREMDRVLKPKGIAVLIVSEPEVLKEAIRKVAWKQLQFIPMRLLGQSAVIMVYRKLTED